MKTEQESAEEKCEEASVVQRQLSEAESDEAVTVKKEQVSREKVMKSETRNSILQIR